VYDSQKQYFLEKGYKNIYSYAKNREHEIYLGKMGFVETQESDKRIFVKNLDGIASMEQS